jgi:hypothetical protein
MDYRSNSIPESSSKEMPPPSTGFTPLAYLNNHKNVQKHR